MEIAPHVTLPVLPRRLMGVLAASVLLSACGAESASERASRPPSAIVVSAAIFDKQVAVSPKRFGAGPVRLVITNQTGSSKELRLETAGRETGLRQRTGPINPSDTASLQADLPQGEYTVTVGDGDDAATATLAVGPERANSDNDLLQP